MLEWIRFYFCLAVCAAVVSLTSIAAGQTAFVYLQGDWKYFASGQAAQVGWNGVGFDDASWGSGEAPLGYATGVAFSGTKIENSANTFYFRAPEFDVENPNDVTKLTLETIYAQGFVAYLNGQEILRRSMPAGAVTYDTPAQAHTPTSALETIDVSAAASALVSGKNVFAVEVHQSDPFGPFMVWYARLTYDTQSLRVTRGPYLQRVAPTSAVVRWRTNRASDSRVAFGADPTQLDKNQSDAAAVVDHEIVLENLEPATAYAYSVGSGTETLAGGDANHVFRTAPTGGATNPLSVWVLGDSGSQDATARKVRDAYSSHVAGKTPDVWLMLGDNAYPDGEDVHYQYAIFENMFEATARRSALWPTFGNHDWGDGINDAETQSGPYFDLHTLPTKAEAGGAPSSTEGYFSFDHGNVHFMSLETIQLKTPEQISWITADVASTKQPWVIAYFHVPPYTKGSHDSDQGGHEFARQGLAATLEAAGVDLVLAGHSHVYERSILIDGHYGLSGEFAADPAKYTKDPGDGREDGDGVYQKPAERGPHQGTVYVVSGKSGDRGGAMNLDHPVMIELLDPYSGLTKKGLDVGGSLSIRIDNQRLDAEYVDHEGDVLDHFTIVKGEGTTGVGGSGGGAGSGGSGGSAGSMPGSSDDGGCGCRFDGGGRTSPFAIAAWAIAFALRRRRAA